MTPIRLTPAQLDAALGVRRAGKTRAMLEATAATPGAVFIRGTDVCRCTGHAVPLQLAGLAEVARLRAAGRP